MLLGGVGKCGETLELTHTLGTLAATLGARYPTEFINLFNTDFSACIARAVCHIDQNFLHEAHLVSVGGELTVSLFAYLVVQDCFLQGVEDFYSLILILGIEHLTLEFHQTRSKSDL